MIGKLQIYDMVFKRIKKKQKKQSTPSLYTILYSRHFNQSKTDWSYYFIENKILHFLALEKVVNSCDMYPQYKGAKNMTN